MDRDQEGRITSTVDRITSNINTLRTDAEYNGAEGYQAAVKALSRFNGPLLMLAGLVAEARDEVRKQDRGGWEDTEADHYDEAVTHLEQAIREIRGGVGS
jgi:hypothetical protein